MEVWHLCGVLEMLHVTPPWLKHLLYTFIAGFMILILLYSVFVQTLISGYICAPAMSVETRKANVF